jgi:hypothetical protein
VLWRFRDPNISYRPGQSASVRSDTNGKVFEDPYEPLNSPSRCATLREDSLRPPSTLSGWLSSVTLVSVVLRRYREPRRLVPAPTATRCVPRFKFLGGRSALVCTATSFGGSLPSITPLNPRFTTPY